jgi:hypothetical protein
VGKAQYDAVKGLVVQVEVFAARPGDLPAPVDRGGVRQQREPQSYRDREGQRADRRGLYSPREQQVRNEDQRRELDPRRQPDSDALALDAVRQREIAHHQGQQHEVDLPEEQCHRNRFEPEAHRGDRKRRRRPGQAGGPPGESQGKVRHHRQQPDREHRQPDLPGRERRTAPRSEQERGERRVGERQLRRPSSSA